MVGWWIGTDGLMGAVQLARYGAPLRAACSIGSLAALMCVGACRGEPPPAQDSAAPGASAAVGLAESVDTAMAGDTTGCPMWGRWRECSVAKRLERAGLVAERRDEPERHDFMSVPGTVFETQRTEVQVFLYASAEARARDTDALDSATVSPRGRRIVWRAPAVLVTSGNLAAIILGLNEREVERAALALGAGLSPRPPR